MQKVEIVLPEDQRRALEALSDRTGQQVSELIRQGIDLVLQGTNGASAEWRRATDAALGIWADHEEIDDIGNMVRHGAKARFPNIYADD